MTDFQPIDTAPTMLCVLLLHEYYSHGRIRHGYRNRKGEWIGINANGTERRLNFAPTGWMYLPTEPAQAIEARSGETGTGSIRQDESAVPAGDAPNTDGQQPGDEK